MLGTWLNWRAAVEDDKGTSAVEFAFFLPLLILLIMGIVDLSMGLNRKYEIQQASYRTLELVSAGPARTDFSFLRAEAAVAAGEPEANVAVQSWLECDGVRQASFTNECTSGQEITRFVSVGIVSHFRPMFASGPLASAFGSGKNGTFPLRALSTVRLQ